MKLYYQPNGGISAVPDLIDSYELKVFGCSTPKDYGNGNTYFVREADAISVFIKDVSDFEPDLILIESMNVKMITAIRKVRDFFLGPIILFWGDLLERNSYFLLKEICKYIDLAVVVNKNLKEFDSCKNAPVIYTLFPASSKLYYPKPDLGKKYDAVFAGNLYSKGWSNRNQPMMDRLELVNAFASRPHFGLFGNESWKELGLPVQGWVDELALSKIYNQSKIVLASDQILTISGFTSNRTTKALLSGSFLLIRKFTGIEEIYKNHHHLTWFETVDEALALADYYLVHEDEREQIALNGYVFARENMDLLPNITKWIEMAQTNPNQSIELGSGLRYRLWLLSHFLRRVFIRLGGETGLLSPDWFWRI